MEPTIQKAIEHYGTEHQLLKLIEEMGELTSSIIKYIQTGSQVELGNVRAEKTDVKILLDQLELVIPENHSHRQVQLERLELKMNNTTGG